MADVAVTLESAPGLQAEDMTLRRIITYGTATVVANAGTAPTTGTPLDWATIVNGNFGSGAYTIPNVGPTAAGGGPLFAEFVSTSPTSTQSYRYSSADNSLVVLVAGAPVVIGIVADTVAFKAEFLKDGF